MNYQVLDVETTIFAKGNPFSRINQLCLIGIGDYMGMDKDKIQSKIDDCELIIGFNIKFDLHWIKRYGISFEGKRVWDCQLADFIISGQSNPYPSLDSVAAKYGLGSKHNVVSTEYWEKGIDTTEIPEKLLREYLQQDLLLTEQVYHNQLLFFNSNPQLYKLFRLHCLDLLVLQEMEYNGMLFDCKEAAILAEVEEKRQREIEDELRKGYENIPINFASRDHLSAYLFGGFITEEIPQLIGIYKTGARKGEAKYKKVEFKHELQRLVTPPKGSELKKDGFFSTDENTLKGISCSRVGRRRLDLILERAKSAKITGTYYQGIPELIDKMDWPSNVIHGQFNQCVAATGRLSSSKPNLQNFAGEVDKLLRSRYG